MESCGVTKIPPNEGIAPNAHGADDTIVAAQLSHTVDVSTNVYNKVGIQRQQTAVQNLDNALRPQQPIQRAS